MAEPAPLTIRRAWERPADADLAALRDAPTGFVVDGLGRAGAMSHTIRPVWDGGAFIGTALTVWTTPRDNLAPYAALAFARPGDVLLVATGESDGYSVAGDILIGMARNAGVRAVVTDGLVRDVAGIREVGIPVYARGVSPNSPLKNGPGSIGLPITLGGVVIEPGDVVLGDADGVVVVPRSRLAEAIAELPAIRAKEAEMDAAVKGGLSRPGWLDTTLARPDVRWID